MKKTRKKTDLGDGTVVLASYETLSHAAEHCRTHLGPALVHAHVTRPYSHSMSDDELLYRPQAELEEQAKRDPILQFGEYLVRKKIATKDDLARRLVTRA